MNPSFSDSDKTFLKAAGISASGPSDNSDVFSPQEMQSRVDRLKREGKLPTLDAFMAAFHNAAGINNAPSAGDCGEPSHSTPAGVPICSECGRSTRNMEQLVCKPCESGTRLLLTAADRKLLRQMGISR